MIHLDTGFVIGALVRGSMEDKALRGWLGSGERLGMSTVAWSELLCGPIESFHLELVSRLIVERHPFTEEAALRAAELFNGSGRRRGSLADCMIAATALELGVPLATSNPRDFERFSSHGLVLRAVSAGPGGA